MKGPQNWFRRSGKENITWLFQWFVHLSKMKVKWSRYRPGVAQRVGTGIALLFHDRGTRRGWVISSTPRPHFTPGKDPVSILQEDDWAPGSLWTGGKSRPHRDSIPDRPARSQSLYRLSYIRVSNKIKKKRQRQKLITEVHICLSPVILLNIIKMCILYNWYRNNDIFYITVRRFIF